MTSLFAQLFLAIQAHIKDQVPEIRYIDQDIGQLEYYETRPAVSWPCLLIDFPSAQFEDHHQGVQWAAISLNARLGFSPFSSASSLSPDISKEHALQFYELEGKVYKALQGFEAGGLVQPFTRISVATEKREDPFRVREMIFTTATEDHTMMSVNMKAAGLDLEKEFVRQ